MNGILYIVGVPIGNLGDFSPRAEEILKSVDLIAAEDTRVTQKLLNRFSIHTPTISYHAHNFKMRGQELIAKLKEGKNIAVVTDAGMPCISDPGEDLVRLAADEGIVVQVVPGPNAAISALAVSGLSTSRFVFEGFLTTNQTGRLSRLAEIAFLPQTLIFYEAPHKLKNTLEDLYKVLGDRKVALVRELTKIHEEAERTTLLGAIKIYNEKKPKGEYVIVVEGAAEDKNKATTLEEAVALAKELPLKPAEAAKKAAEISGYKKTEIYKRLMEEK